MSQPISPRRIQKSAASLLIANVIALAIIGVSYIVYAQRLTPGEFGLYSVALALASIGTLVLDAGLKNSIIKAPSDLNQSEEGALLALMMGGSFSAIGCLWGCQNIIFHFFPAVSQDYQFLAIFSSIYWLSYPVIVFPTAALERTLRYGQIAWVESIGAILERALPIIFMVSFHQRLDAFIWGVLLGRLFRMIVLAKYHLPCLSYPTFSQIQRLRPILSEGLWIQGATLFALFRDNLHILLVGIMFGKDWVGYYAWGLQICLITSQIFVQISARISVPVFLQAGTFEAMWRVCMKQIQLLTILTSPILCVLLLLISDINQAIFQGKWAAAIPLLPILFARMLPGLAATPLSTLLMVYRGGAAFLKANLYWTILEFGLGLIALWAIGPIGLAWSYAAGIWLGLVIWITLLHEQSISLLRETCASIFQRSSLILALSLSLVIYWHCHNSPFTMLGNHLGLLIPLLILPIAYVSEHQVRSLLGSKLWMKQD
jgi:O-antigen/teichoic acid export membrane protein